MSLQEFLLAELVDSARARTPAEIVGEFEQQLARGAGQGSSPTSSAAFVRAVRDEP